MFNRNEFKHLLTDFAALSFLRLLGRDSVLNEINFASMLGCLLLPESI